MPICTNCGEEIEFRYIGGRCVPIHPGGGWHCSGRNHSDTAVAVPLTGLREWPGFKLTTCNPTKCPECGDDVFFIRHNGGCVWVDELGWPWPKHPCFDKPHEPTYTFALLAAKSSRLTNPKIGVVTRIDSDTKFAEPAIEIKLPNSSLISLILRWTPPDSALLGALVIFSKEDSLLWHQTHAEIPFHSFSEKSTVRAGWYKCPICQAHVKHNTSHEEYCRKKFSQKNISKNNPANVEPKPNVKAFLPTINIPSKRKPIIVYKARPNRRMTPVPSATTVAPAQTPSAKRMSLESRIQLAVDSIARQAWNSVNTLQQPEEKFRQAKHKAIELIAMLSPSIKRQVGNFFTSAKWQPLIERRPKS